jgi:hypothetical protein
MNLSCSARAYRRGERGMPQIVLEQFHSQQRAVPCNNPACSYTHARTAAEEYIVLIRIVFEVP